MNSMVNVANRLKILEDKDGVNVTVSDAKKLFMFNSRHIDHLILSLFGQLITILDIFLMVKKIQAKLSYHSGNQLKQFILQLCIPYLST